MTGLLNLKNMLLLAIFSAAVGFACGYVTKGEFVKASQTTDLIKDRKDTAGAVVESVKKSSEIEDRVNTQKGRLLELSKGAENGAKKTYKARCENENTVIDWKLSVGTVGMLNAMRKGAASDSASVVDAESEAATTIGLKELQSNDSEIVILYWELAERHNSLVDSVQSFMNKQQNQ